VGEVEYFRRYFLEYLSEKVKRELGKEVIGVVGPLRTYLPFVIGMNEECLVDIEAIETYISLARNVEELRALADFLITHERKHKELSSRRPMLEHKMLSPVEIMWIANQCEDYYLDSFVVKPPAIEERRRLKALKAAISYYSKRRRKPSVHKLIGACELLAIYGATGDGSKLQRLLRRTVGKRAWPFVKRIVDLIKSIKTEEDLWKAEREIVNIVAELKSMGVVE